MARDKDIEDAKKGYIKLIVLIAVLGITLIFRNNILSRTIVNGESMYPTLKDSEIMFVRKYNLDNIKRGDIVTARQGGKLVVKRVIGLPNEEVIIDATKVYIDGNVLDEAYINDMAPDEVEDNSFYKWKLNQDEYIVLGDNRMHSVDSREHGTVNTSEIQGVMTYRLLGGRIKDTTYYFILDLILSIIGVIAIKVDRMRLLCYGVGTTIIIILI